MLIIVLFCGCNEYGKRILGTAYESFTSLRMG